MNEQLIKKAQSLAYSKTIQNESSSEPVKPYTAREIAERRIVDRELEKDAPSTGYAELDILVAGFVPGRLYTMAADTNVGKTALAANFSVRVSKQKKKVLYFALEPDNRIADYFASVRYNKEYGQLTDDDLVFDDKYIDVILLDQISTIEGMVKFVKETQEQYALIVVDHIGYFTRKDSDHIQQQSNVLKELAALSKTKSTAVMLIAELNKTYNGGIPSMNQIKGSGSFKYDSTEVFAIVREESEDKTNYSEIGKLYILKTKHGSNGAIDLFFSTRKANIVTTTDVIPPQENSEPSLHLANDEQIIESEVEIL